MTDLLAIIGTYYLLAVMEIVVSCPFGVAKLNSQPTQIRVILEFHVLVC